MVKWKLDSFDYYQGEITRLNKALEQAGRDITHHESQTLCAR